MNTWIALLRGINVGGKNIVKMKELRTELMNAGLLEVETYIQSGNVVFGSSAKQPKSLERKIQNTIERSFGFRPHTFVLSLSDLNAAIDGNPYEDKTIDPKTLHFSFFRPAAKPPKANEFEAAKTPTESYHLGERVFYLLAPDGIARSKLAMKVDSILGKETTTRNFRTVQKILSLAQQRDAG